MLMYVLERGGANSIARFVPFSQIRTHNTRSKLNGWFNPSPTNDAHMRHGLSIGQ